MYNYKELFLETIVIILGIQVVIITSVILSILIIVTFGIVILLVL